MCARVMWHVLLTCTRVRAVCGGAQVRRGQACGLCAFTSVSMHPCVCARGGCYAHMCSHTNGSVGVLHARYTCAHAHHTVCSAWGSRMCEYSYTRVWRVHGWCACVCMCAVTVHTADCVHVRCVCTHLCVGVRCTCCAWRSRSRSAAPGSAERMACRAASSRRPGWKHVDGLWGREAGSTFWVGGVARSCTDPGARALHLEALWLPGP